MARNLKKQNTIEAPCNCVPWLLTLLRIGMGWIFLWPFLDKLFGLGFSTTPENAWLNGGSPTTGFLTHATKGPFASFFQALAGLPVIDIIFMIGLLFIGVSLISGIFTRLAAYAGSLMLFLMWLAVLPPEHNPFLDDHLIYPLILLLLSGLQAGRFFGLGHWWESQKLVKKYRFLA
ncbi:hypothetical protein CL622_01020 [archaeon]|mgnify:CR=1 FL=1|nr:hypothetical protein [archaeon]